MPGLRAILRQDPDVIMIGEIRDFETAQIAIQASLTGHLVLATLHTNDAASAVTRLTDMGVEPFLLSSSPAGRAGPAPGAQVCRLRRQELQVCGHTATRAHRPVRAAGGGRRPARLVHNRASEADIRAAALAAGRCPAHARMASALIIAGVTTRRKGPVFAGFTGDAGLIAQMAPRPQSDPAPKIDHPFPATPMSLFARPHYTSVATCFWTAIWKKSPSSAGQQAGRALLWDKKVDRSLLTGLPRRPRQLVEAVRVLTPYDGY